MFQEKKRTTLACEYDRPKGVDCVSCLIYRHIVDRSRLLEQELLLFLYRGVVLLSPFTQSTILFVYV
jgi:hypothetical protein